MRRELNSKDEMLMRLFYAIYVVLLCSGFFLVLRGLVGVRVDELILGALFGIIAWRLRCFGQKKLDFKRLYIIFPMGEEPPKTSYGQRKLIESLVTAFYESDDWTERQDIRKKLEQLVQQEPLYMEAYAQELRQVHPAMFNHGAKENHPPIN